MNERYLFRGKRTNDGRWVQGSLVNETNVCSIIDYANSETDTYSWNDIIPESVGQFTGLLDCEGNKIFEGDVIESFNSMGEKVNHLVIFEKEEARFAIEHTQNREWNTPMRLLQSWVRAYNKVVCGNVFDNPELISK